MAHPQPVRGGDVLARLPPDFPRPRPPARARGPVPAPRDGVRAPGERVRPRLGGGAREASGEAFAGARVPGGLPAHVHLHRGAVPVGAGHAVQRPAAAAAHRGGDRVQRGGRRELRVQHGHVRLRAHHDARRRGPEFLPSFAGLLHAAPRRARAQPFDVRAVPQMFEALAARSAGGDHR